MRKTRMVSVVIAAAVAAAVVVASPATWAQSPKEQLVQLVEKLQASPDDDALRGQIIKLAEEAKPAIPEEARQHFIKGITLAQTAKTVAGQALAVKAFQEALKIAPWWGDAYYNLAVAQELAGQLDVARSSLQFYVLTNPGEKESRDAQDRIYALEAKQDLAIAKSAAAKAAAETDTPQMREERFLDGLEGAIFSNTEFRSRDEFSAASYTRVNILVRDRQLIPSTTWWWADQSPPALNSGKELPRLELTGRVLTYDSGGGLFPADCNPITLTISDDGNRITVTATCFGRINVVDLPRVN